MFQTIAVTPGERNCHNDYRLTAQNAPGHRAATLVTNISPCRRQQLRSAGEPSSSRITAMLALMRERKDCRCWSISPPPRFHIICHSFSSAAFWLTIDFSRPAEFSFLPRSSAYFSPARCRSLCAGETPPKRWRCARDDARCGCLKGDGLIYLRPSWHYADFAGGCSRGGDGLHLPCSERRRLVSYFVWCRDTIILSARRAVTCRASPESAGARRAAVAVLWLITFRDFGIAARWRR